jgi:tight adherence protein C
MINVEFWLLVAVATAVVSGFRLFRITRREATQQLRLEAFRGTVDHIQASDARWYRQFANLIAASPILGVVEQQRLIKLLAAAGIKDRTSLANFIAIKVGCTIGLVGLTWLALERWDLFSSIPFARPAALVSALAGGWRLPDLVLNRLVKRRRLRLEQGMPDALDLLVVCAEAGLSLNQSIGEVSQRLFLSNRDVADEFAITSAEMQILPDFAQALDNLVKRTGLDELRSLVATLKQTLKFGTPLAESLRVIAAEMRAARHARIEERAARLPVLLAFPMMVFFLPALLMVVGTPLVLRMVDMFRSLIITLPF